MSMYTEFHFNVELKEHTPQNTLGILGYMPDPWRTGAPDIPEHSLFKTERWPQVLCGDSAYFPMEQRSELTIDEDGVISLSVRSNLKNYDNEIEKFLDWISPYVDTLFDEMVGYFRYEENEHPTLIYTKNNPIQLISVEDLCKE